MFTRCRFRGRHTNSFRSRTFNFDDLGHGAIEVHLITHLQHAADVLHHDASQCVNVCRAQFQTELPISGAVGRGARPFRLVEKRGLDIRNLSRSGLAVAGDSRGGHGADPVARAAAPRTACRSSFSISPVARE